MTVTTTPLGLSFSDIGTGPMKSMATQEGTLKTAISQMGPNPTTAQLLDMQQQMQQWSMLVDMSSTLNKVLADTMKGIIQKSG